MVPVILRMTTPLISHEHIIVDGGNLFRRLMVVSFQTARNELHDVFCQWPVNYVAVCICLRCPAGVCVFKTYYKHIWARSTNFISG